jgi:hypothetical protein
VILSIEGGGFREDKLVGMIARWLLHDYINKSVA